MEADEKVPQMDGEKPAEELQNVVVHIARDLRGATLTLVRKSDSQYLGQVSFEASAQEHIGVIGKLFAAFCESQPSLIQVPGQMAPGLRGQNGAGRR